MPSEILSFFIIAALVAIIGVLLTRRQKTKTHPTVLTDAGLEQKVQVMLQQGDNKVPIVKFVREQTGAGLVEAKQFVDRVEQEHTH